MEGITAAEILMALAWPSVEALGLGLIDRMFVTGSLGCWLGRLTAGEGGASLVLKALIVPSLLAGGTIHGVLTSVVLESSSLAAIPVLDFQGHALPDGGWNILCWGRLLVVFVVP